MMISILIPLYNGIEFLPESVSSVLTQTFTKWEIIIGINGHPGPRPGGSTTPDRPESQVFNQVSDYISTLEEKNKIKVLNLSTKGKPASLNEMLKYAEGDWICLLDVDDKWLPTKLEEQIPFMAGYDVIGTGCQYFGNSSDIPDIPEGDLQNFNFFLTNPIINSSCLVKKRLCYWANHNLEDYDLWLRLKKDGRKFYNVPKILVLHRIHSESAFNSKGNHNNVNRLLLNHSRSRIKVIRFK